MKFYLTESTRNHDSFTDYLGTDKSAAIEAGKSEWASLTAYDKQYTVIEVQEWDLPDDIDADDQEAITEAMIEACGYDLVTSFSNKEEE